MYLENKNMKLEIYFIIVSIIIGVIIGETLAIIYL
tara:strand:- start:369 stop:473 length:105 start_codon:yes stop_codon:yes gene_type:complete